jgi:hypothetical protein
MKTYILAGLIALGLAAAFVSVSFIQGPITAQAATDN